MCVKFRDECHEHEHEFIYIQHTKGEKIEREKKSIEEMSMTRWNCIELLRERERRYEKMNGKPVSVISAMQAQK